ncbi:MAG: AMP-binding protein, partial [bacterium]|nr:AMP-binding protein [bacterium]
SESILKDSDFADTDSQVWHNYLNQTGHTDFLMSLGERDLRYRWAETAARAVDIAQYSLRHMFAQRVKLSPKKPLFRDMSKQDATVWSYRVIDQRARSLAAGLLKINKTPQVAIISDNHVESAISDLACLFYNILVTPLNVHFNAETIAYIFDKLGINIALTDNVEHRNKLLEVRKLAKSKFDIYAILPDAE